MKKDYSSKFVSDKKTEKTSKTVHKKECNEKDSKYYDSDKNKSLKDDKNSANKRTSSNLGGLETGMPCSKKAKTSELDYVIKKKDDE